MSLDDRIQWIQIRLLLMLSIAFVIFLAWWAYGHYTAVLQPCSLRRPPPLPPPPLVPTPLDPEYYLAWLVWLRDCIGLDEDFKNSIFFR